MSGHTLPKVFSDTQDFDVRLSHALGVVRTFVREAACAVCGGHAYLLHASDDRIYLRCHDCGHETPGWQIDTGRDRRSRPDALSMSVVER